jgi:hypothetical protein
LDFIYAIKATLAAKRTPNAASAVDRALDGVGAGDTEHVAAASVPEVHEVAPDTVYPVLHVG